MRLSGFKMLFDIRSLAVQLLVFSSVASAVPLSPERRAVINHDAVVGFPQTVPSGVAGTLYLKYKPYLKVFNGCVPFPAVNSKGDTRYATSPKSTTTSADVLQWRPRNIWRPIRQLLFIAWTSLRPFWNLQWRIRHHVQLVHAQRLPLSWTRASPRMGERCRLAFFSIHNCNCPRSRHLRPRRISEREVPAIYWH
jgi:hypothetical protein